MKREAARLAQLRQLLLPTLVLLAWLALGFVLPKFWPSDARTDDSLRAIRVRQVYLTLLWLLGAVTVNRWLCVVALDGFAARALGKPIQKIFKDLLAIGLLGIAVVGILVTVFGQSMASFWAASGVLGIVLGIALRPIILDFFAGLGANLDRAYSIGDWIVVNGQGETFGGWIDEINWRTVRLRTRDGYIVLMPNSRLATNPVVNHARPQSESRFHLCLRLDAEVAVDRALRILSAAVFASTTRPDGPSPKPAPDVLVSDASGLGIEYTVRFWLDPAKASPEVVKSAVWIKVLDHLGKAGLTVAHPHENVFLARLPRIAHGFKQIDDRVAFLRRVVLFQNFPESSLRSLAAEVRLRAVHPAQVLVRAGDEGDSMFLVAEGTLRVFRPPVAGGEPIELATLQPGDLFGERSLLTDERRNASVAALTECILLEITRDALRQLLNQEPELLPILERTVADREQANQAKAEVVTAGGRTQASAGRAQAIIARMRELILGPG